MFKSASVLATILFLVLQVSGAPTFVSGPTLTKDAQNRYWVDFTMSEATDVAVTIIDMRDSTIVCHLAAGKLGTNAPSPLVSGTNAQHIEWDGKDDLGFTIAAPANCKARVQAGMKIKRKNTIGDNPYSFSGASSKFGGSFAAQGASGLGLGMVEGADGSVFICGTPGPVYHHHEQWPYKYIRQYNAQGEYVKTVFPFAAGLDTGKVSGWGIFKRADGKYVPVNASNSLPGYTNTLLGTPFSPGGVLLGLDTGNNIRFGTFRSFLSVGPDGSLPGYNGSIPSGQVGISTIRGNLLISSPAFPSGLIAGSVPTAQRYMDGTTYMTMLPNKKEALISGIFYSIGANGHMTAAPDSTFYRDGQVFKVNLATGAATSWLQLPSVPQAKADRQAALNCDGTWASIHGTAIDALGRVYVCERLGKRIAIYDTNATLLHSIPLAGPDVVRISRKTGAIYAVSRTQSPTSPSTGTIKLFKFASIEQGMAPVCSLTLSTGVSGGNMVVSDANPETWVWVGYGPIQVQIYKDMGTSFSLTRDFKALSENTLQGYARLAVDRRNETVYINNTWHGLYKVTDWAQPVPVNCSTTINVKPFNTRVMYGTDMTVSPHGMLYVRQSIVSDGGQYAGPITRWTTDRLHAPVKWVNSDSNVLTPRVNGRYGATTGERGLSVGIDNRVAVSPGNGNWSAARYPDSGNTGTITGGDTLVRLISPSGRGGGGAVRVDLKGNIYVGAIMNMAVMDLPAPLYPEYANDWAYKTCRGTIVKFPPDIMNGRVEPTGPTGATKAYNIGLAPFSKDRGAGGCVCRSPRFDVDPFGRLISPNCVTCEVMVMDNAGNEILRFGEWGNTDFQTADSTRVPLMWATGTAASDNNIFVADYGGLRMHRVAILYDTDSDPALQPKPLNGDASEKPGRKVSLSSKPVPFNPVSRVTVRLNGATRIRLDVFDVSGRFITTVASDILAAGSHEFQWKGTDRQGRAVSAGTYVYRLVAGSQELHAKTILAK